MTSFTLGCSAAAPSACDSLVANVRRWDTLAGCLHSTFPLDNIPFDKYWSPDARVLDYGCGEGRLLKYLMLRRGACVQGCDTSPRMCAIARTVAPTLEVVGIDDPRVLPVALASFDAVAVVAVLSSIVPVHERRAAISRIWSRLPSGGRIAMADFGRSNDARYLARYEHFVAEEYTIITAEGLLIHHFSIAELLELLPPDHVVECTRTVQATTVHGNAIPGHIIMARKT